MSASRWNSSEVGETRRVAVYFCGSENTEQLARSLDGCGDGRNPSDLLGLQSSRRRAQ